MDARSRIRMHARMNMGSCIFAVWESGDACSDWKRGPYVGQWRTPLACGSASEDTYISYTLLSLFDTLPRAGIFSNTRSVFLLTCVWRGVLSPQFATFSSLALFVSFVFWRLSPGLMWSAKTLISNIFSFNEAIHRWTHLWMNGAIGHAEVMYLVRYHTQYMLMLNDMQSVL